MKLIIQNNQIVGTATDAYAGADQVIDAPVGFDITQPYSIVGGVAVLDSTTVAQKAADAAAVATVKVDPMVTYLLTHTPAEISTYVGTQVTSLATAVPILQKMAFIISVLAKDKLR